MKSESVLKAYEIAKEIYSELGIDTEKAISELDKVSISLHCWQGDDCLGFENKEKGLTGGIMTTGNYMGRARNPEELMADLQKAMSYIPGHKKVNIHAFYLDTEKSIDRNEIEPEHYLSWADWAVSQGIGLDFNPTYFSHDKSSDGFTLSSRDESIRQFWIEHGKRCRKVGEFFGKKTGKTCVTNFWIPDGYKDIPIDTLSPRLRLIDSLDKIFNEKIDKKYNKDAVESKLFGIGSESYVTGSHEFYMGYVFTKKNAMIALDAGHFHPTEMISAKISSVLAFSDELLLHVSRPVRWDSDHVVIFDDELNQIMVEIVRNGALGKVNIALDYFDASINRLAAWIIGARNTRRALLKALLEPTEMLKKAEAAGDYTTRLAMLEELKNYPLNAVWDYYCHKNNVPVRDKWLKEIKDYENNILIYR